MATSGTSNHHSIFIQEVKKKVKPFCRIKRAKVFTFRKDFMREAQQPAGYTSFLESLPSLKICGFI
jgi:hypothetical protein